jgi:hypothetical protein
MNSSHHNRSFFRYLNRFFHLLKLDKEYDIIGSDKILSKCVLIEKNKTFFASKSINIKHHS